MIMATNMPALRRATLVLVVSAFALAGFARADDPPQPSAEAAAAGGQKGGRGGAQSASQNASSSAEPHRLPSDSNSKQTLYFPVRTVNFASTAGSIRVFDGKG